MSIPIQDPDPIRDADRNDAIIEWAQRGNNALRVTSSSWTVAPEVADRTVLIDAGAEVVLPGGEDDIPVGFYTLLFASHADGFTVNADAVDLEGDEPGLSAAQNGSIFIEKVAPNTWVVVGGS